MDGDEADFNRLVMLKRQYNNVLLYVDEAHGIGVRGERGLGCAEEQGCIGEIDFLCGTFGKALASVGGYIVCSKTIHDYLVNKMRTLIFTTALPPVNMMWTCFILERLAEFHDKRQHLQHISCLLKEGLLDAGYECPSTSHIIPLTIGESAATILKAEELQRKGFYALPVRPPTVPEGTSRIRFSLTAALTGDLLVCYDYRSLDFDFSLLKGYEDIRVVGWSMGVWAASQVLSHFHLPISESVAVNGTVTPVDDLRGISIAIYEGTLKGLNDITLKKFFRRMCGSASLLGDFLSKSPHRFIEDVKEELFLIARQVESLAPARFFWSKAVVGKGDLIFIPANQKNAWSELGVQIEEEDIAHYSDVFLRNIVCG